MEKETFFVKLKDLFNEPSSLNEDTLFKELEGYGSLSALLVLNFVQEEFDKELNRRNFRKINTVKELMEEIGMEEFSV